MPMIAQALFCDFGLNVLRHSLSRLGGFASGSISNMRIDDAKPTLIVSSDAGMRGVKKKKRFLISTCWMRRLS